MPQRPQGSLRLPGPDGWRPDEGLTPLPPGYEPVRHEPRHGETRPPRPPDPCRPEDSPWHRTQRLSRPEPVAPDPGRPAQASYDPGEFHPQDQYGDRGDRGEYGEYGEPGEYGGRDRYGESGPYSEPGHYPGSPGGEYEEEYGDGGDRFVPGFGEEGDTEHEQGRSGHRSRRARRDRRNNDDGGRGGRPRRRFRWIAPLVALLVIVVPLAVGGVYAYGLYQNKYHPADYSGVGAGSVVVQVTSGDSPTSLAPKLVKLGVVASSRAFVLAAEHSTNSSGLLPGFYGMHRHMKASLAYAILINPKNMVQIRVTIPEGWRLSQIVAFLGAKSGIPLSAYAKVLKDPAQLHLPGYANGKPEGYLFPATYDVQPHETALGVLTGMVKRFNQEAANVALPVAAKQAHLTQAQVVVVASLVQAEGGRLSDYPKIARVIYNRLAHGMPLQLDSTVLYGLNKFGILATDKDLTSPSPYNTYKHKGLPPGPIDSPGAAAIQAVLHPVAGLWLYFVTVNPKTGETLYTSSFAQFQQFRQELAHNLAKG
ncbi:MAG: endolytic transglycosylase MltG [Streptosporangiaceae bacterium]